MPRLPQSLSDDASERYTLYCINEKPGHYYQLKFVLLYAWHDLNINILNFLETIPEERQMRMKGEDFIQYPERYLGDVCRWLKIRDDDEAIEAMMHPENSSFACFGPVTALFGNDPNFLRGAAFRKHTPKVPPLDAPLPWRDDDKRLCHEVVKLAQEFGYS